MSTHIDQLITTIDQALADHERFLARAFPESPLVQERTAVHNTRCRRCHGTIPTGDRLRVFLHDGNPVGTGPAEHITCPNGGA